MAGIAATSAACVVPAAAAAIFDVTTYGALGDGSTDDTSAIQSAIDACEAAGGGTVYFPRGIYVVNGALQDTSRSNAQLLLPRRDAVDTEAITVVLKGEAPPPAIYSVVGATPLPNNLSVIKGTLNTGTGAMIGAHGPVGTFQGFTNLYLVVRDLTLQMPANPTLTALDASLVCELDADNLLINAGNFDVDTISAQTTSTSYGLRTPGNNNGALTRLGIVTVVGFYNGYEIGEHCLGQDVSAAACKQAFVFVQVYHSSMFTRLMTVHCQKGLVFIGEHVVQIGEFNIEHASAGTWNIVYDVDDASNYAHGALYWHVVLANVGIDNTFLVNGAAGLRCTRLYDGATGISVQLNPSDKHADIALTGANLVATKGGSNALRSVRATRGIDASESGYFEIVATVAGTAHSPFTLVGVATSEMVLSNFVGFGTTSWGYYQETGNKVTNNTLTAYGAGWTTGDILSVAFKAGKVWFAKNGVWQGSGDPAAGTGEAFGGITGTILPAISLYRLTAPAHVLTARFKLSSFTYAPPTGFSPWGS